MRYFKDDVGGVYAYSGDDVIAGWVKKGLVEMTPAEVAAHLSPPPVLVTREQIEGIRLRAYADPITGSDRYFAEAVRLQAMGGTQADIDAAKSAGAARYAEIQALYPWPA